MIGIRARALEEKDIEIGKYMPITIGETNYNHQLGWNLYGIYENKKAIQKYKRVIVFEGEKSVLQHYSYYGEDSCAVAVCGSSINKNQMGLLKKMGVNEVILAFDKEYDNCYSLKGKKYRQKIIDMGKKYLYCANFSYIFDEKNFLREKDSPTDQGKEIFNKLYERRIKIR